MYVSALHRRTFFMPLCLKCQCFAGYRYELFCLVKHAQTPHCLVSTHDASSLKYIHTWATKVKNPVLYSAPVAGILSDVRSGELIVERWQGCCRAVQPGHVSRGSNVALSLSATPSDSLLCFCPCPVVLFRSIDALVLRFEAPDSRNRWDSPLFTILKDDTLPYEDISDALFKRKAPPPNQSTQSVGPRALRVCLGWRLSLSEHISVLFCLVFSPLQQPLSSANFLYELDKITQDVLMVSVVVLLSGAGGHVFFLPEQLYVRFKRLKTLKEAICDHWWCNVQYHEANWHLNNQACLVSVENNHPFYRQIKDSTL